MAGVEQQDDRRDEFVLAEAALVALGGDELRDEIVAGLAPAQGDKCAHVGREIARGRGCGVLVGACRGELIHRHHLVRPVEQPRRIDGRRADQRRDHADRKRRGEAGDEIVARRELVDQPLGHFGDGGRQPLDLARHEGAVDEGAQPRVLGRLQLQQRMALDGVEIGQMIAGAAASRVLRASPNAGSAGRSACRAAAPRPPHGRQSTRSRNPPRTPGRRRAAAHRRRRGRRRRRDRGDFG